MSFESSSFARWKPSGRVATIALALLIASFLGYVLQRHSAELRDNVSRRDSIAYWAAGRLLAHKENPYSTSGVLALERAQGYSAAKPLVLRTPPWSLFLTVPLGLVSSFVAWACWIALSLGALVVSIRLCWAMYGHDARPPAILLVTAYLFAPVPACLVAGQMGLVLLLGVALFLWWEQTHPLLAGMALLVAFAKPHLLLLFWVVLAIWAVTRKKRAILAGFAIALCLATAIALLFDHAVFEHYRLMLLEASIGHEFIPALSGVLRLLLFRRLFWMQFVPMALGLIWAIWFYWTNRMSWNWRQHGPALFVVSILTTPYAWLTDEVVLLPAIWQAAVWVYDRRYQLSIRSRIVLVIFAALNLLLLLILKAKVPFSTGIYFWSSLVWFGWYMYGKSTRSTPALERGKKSIIPEPQKL